jgi:tRNA-uridine 2-sulfurtransferase
MVRNILYVVQGHDHPALRGDRLVAEQLSWVSEAPHPHWVYTAKPRYRTADAPCEVEQVDAVSCEVRFAEAQWALTPGQSVALYESRVCLGGGVIR